MQQTSVLYHLHFSHPDCTTDVVYILHREMKYGHVWVVCFVQMDFASKAREVVIFCPYWIINKTNLTLKLKDNTPVSSLPPKAAPGLGGVAQPILFG